LILEGGHVFSVDPMWVGCAMPRLTGRRIRSIEALYSVVRFALSGIARPNSITLTTGWVYVTALTAHAPNSGDTTWSNNK
jgi:hypothetical protein